MKGDTKMTRIPKSFRLSKQALDQLMLMKDIENKQAEVFKTIPPSITDVLEASINNLYTMMTDEMAGDNYLTRMTTLIRDAVNQGMQRNDLVLNNITYELAITKEILYTILKAGNYPKQPELIEDLVSNKKSIYQPFIESKINGTVK